MKGLEDILAKAQAIQGQMADLQGKLAETRAEGAAGGGMVKATVNGERKVVAISIEKTVVNPDDIDMLQDLIIAAVNQAQNTMHEKLQAEMQQLTGGMGIPGVF